MSGPDPSAPDLTPGGIAARRAARRPSAINIGTGWKLFGALVVCLFAGMMLTALITVAIWPGEGKLFGPIVCGEARPDAVIVYDTHRVRPGETSVTFEMYCMGPRGDVESHGFAPVFWLALALHTLIVAAIWAAFWVRRRFRRRAARGHAAGQPSSAPPPTFAPPR